jgi:cysteinyl-tRNA synthetase
MAEPAQESQLQLFNTLTGKLEPFIPLEGNKVKMYVCGPTVYDDAHLGHARCYITWDVLYRFLKFLGYDVKYVRNVTDVDDKILNRAKERGETPAELAERNYQSFSDDMKALNVLSPDEEPRATQYIQQMLDGIQALIEKGAAYPTADGSVYFRVSAKADYGKLKFGTDNPEALKKHLEDLKSGARVEVDEEKESPLDFALWKAVPISDPNGWESPWVSRETGKGWGRPGWHMECSAMNHAVFGEQIDIHAGGADLIFPHHENEIAQSEAWSGHQPFAKYWLHNGFVNVSGEKMSKSLGNFSTIKKLRDRYNANTIRYFLLTNHYRMPVDFNEEALQAAENWLKRVSRTLSYALKDLNLTSVEMLAYTANEQKEIDSLAHKLQNDLNTAGALADLNNLLNILRANFRDFAIQKDTVSLIKIPYEGTEKSFSPEKAYKFFLSQLIKAFDLLGFNIELLFEFREPTQVLADNSDTLRKLCEELSGKLIETHSDPTDLTKYLLKTRQAAKAEKNWPQADLIRNRFLEMGWKILDNKDGTTSVEKDGLEILRV